MNRTPDSQTMEVQIALLIAASFLLGYLVKGRWGQKYKPLWVDHITGLPNRANFDHAVKLALRGPTEAGLVIIDLDDFKSVNDQQGHLAGDALLKNAAETLSNLTSDYGTLFRWGGDEFVLLVPTADHHLDNICSMIEAQFSKADVGLRCSTGSARRQPNDTPATFFERADQNLYANKS